MGYRRLLLKYMQHVQQRSGSNWLIQTPLRDVGDPQDFADKAAQDELSARDLGELRSLWTTLERESAEKAEGDLNARTRSLCAEHNLSSADLALHLGWSQHVIEEWLLPPEDPRHRRMLRRDFEHLMNCVSPVLSIGSAPARRREG